MRTLADELELEHIAEAMIVAELLPLPADSRRRVLVRVIQHARDGRLDLVSEAPAPAAPPADGEGPAAPPPSELGGSADREVEDLVRWGCAEARELSAPERTAAFVVARKAKGLPTYVADVADWAGITKPAARARIAAAKALELLVEDADGSIAPPPAWGPL